MGEAKQEEAKVEAKPEEKKEEKKEEKQEEKKEEKEEKKEEAKPSPPPPIILFVDLHCVGCAKKIEKSVLKCRGVEGVEVDMVQNQLTVKGIVDPQALCSRIQKKTLKRARVLSPLPPAEGESKQEQVVPSQVSGITTVELHVNMHCEACAQQLRRKILKMRGVQTAETELSTGKVMVTGTMNGEKLIDYIYRRTGKFATIVPQPPKEEEKKAEEKPPEEKKEEKAEENKEEKAEEKKEEKAEEKKEETTEGNKDGGDKEEKGSGEEQQKEGEGPTNVDIPNGADMVMKRMVYWNGSIISEEEMARRMMMHWMPVYVIERPPPPPQIFSDENPNACCIS